MYNLHQAIYILQKVVGYEKSAFKNCSFRKDLSQAELANLIGVTRQTIGLIEAGNYNPTLKLCVAICQALDKTLDDLFWEDPS